MARTRLFLEVAFVLLSVQTCSGSSGGFLSGGSVIAEELLTAMDEVLGCGGGLPDAHFAAIERELAPMWLSLPKLVDDRAEWRSLRYLAHRYFVQTSSLLIRGFEPGKLLDSSDAGHAVILSNHTPAFVQGLMDPVRAARGFSLHDAVYFVATIEQLAIDSQSSLLESVYAARNQDARHSIGHDGLKHILQDYIIHWFIGERDQATIDELLADAKILEASVPLWPAIKHFIEGRIRSLDFKRQRSPEGRRGEDLMSVSYSFADAHEVVGGITNTFASFWQSECETMKSQLVDMDRDGFGRVRLADFYGTGLEKDWRFGETKDYLRELGALDESSPSMPRVIVANYIQAASNCVVSTPHYMVCCLNECEGYLTEIEDTIGSATASPDQILQLVGNMSSSSTDDELPNLAGYLTSQLYKIAELHGGKVPLHGRLFSQWLHYVFPFECAFPHKTGVSSYMTPLEFAGDGSFMSSEEEMRAHIASGQAELPPNATSTEELWMQWTSEEELIADDSPDLRAPWESGRMFSFGRLAFPALIVALVVYMGLGIRNSKAVEPDFSGSMLKHHLV